MTNLRKTLNAAAFCLSATAAGFASAQDLTVPEEAAIADLKSFFTCQQNEMDQITQAIFGARVEELAQQLRDGIREDNPATSDAQIEAYVSASQDQIKQAALEEYYINLSNDCASAMVDFQATDKMLNEMLRKYGPETFKDMLEARGLSAENAPRFNF